MLTCPVDEIKRWTQIAYKAFYWSTNSWSIPSRRESWGEQQDLNDQWQIRYNNELHQICDESEISKLIQLRKLPWAERVQCIDDTRITKRAFGGRAEGRRSVRPPWKRWADSVVEDAIPGSLKLEDAINGSWRLMERHLDEDSKTQIEYIFIRRPYFLGVIDN